VRFSYFFIEKKSEEQKRSWRTQLRKTSRATVAWEGAPNYPPGSVARVCATFVEVFNNVNRFKGHFSQFWRNTKDRLHKRFFELHDDCLCQMSNTSATWMAQTPPYYFRIQRHPGGFTIVGSRWCQRTNHSTSPSSAVAVPFGSSSASKTMLYYIM